MSKILFISNIAKRVGSFSIASISAAKECGFDFIYAANWNAASSEQRQEDEKRFGIKLAHIDLVRAPYSIHNIRAYRQIIELIKNENIEYIHCNTPTGGLLGRLAGQKCKVKEVIYQVHGFHFYNGAPIHSWMIYYPIERWLSKKTDALITINKEDYERAKDFRLRNNGKVYYVPGVGMELEQYVVSEQTRKKKRKELGLELGDVALISMGDLIKRKNYSVAIEAVANAHNKRLQYYICGQGPEERALKRLSAKLGISDQVHFLGYRTDVKDLLMAADIFLFTSMQEGLSRSLMEAMASGLPCIVSNIRGNVDLITDGKGGKLCNSIESYTQAITSISNSESLRKQMSDYNIEAIKLFDISASQEKMVEIYRNVFR